MDEIIEEYGESIVYVILGVAAISMLLMFLRLLSTI